MISNVLYESTDEFVLANLCDSCGHAHLINKRAKSFTLPLRYFSDIDCFGEINVSKFRARDFSNETHETIAGIRVHIFLSLSEI